jgi:general secretion pathway protein J
MVRYARTTRRHAAHATPRPSTRRLNAGFTLVEILAALVVVGFIFVVLLQGVRFGVRAIAAQSGAQSAVAPLDPADRTLRTIIAAIDPGTYTEPPSFVGTRDAVAFVSDLPVAGGPPLHANIATGLEAHRLVLRWAVRDHTQPFSGRTNGWQTSVLLDDVGSLRIAYAAGGGAQWLDAWRGERLPRLIRIETTHRDGSPFMTIIASPQRDRPDQ